jgi:hypothetical protein
MNETSEIKTEFDSAVAVARRALKEFNRDPLVPSKRGGLRLSPWWRVYVEASGVAVRWYRQIVRRAAYAYSERPAASRASA